MQTFHEENFVCLCACTRARAIAFISVINERTTLCIYTYTIHTAHEHSLQFFSSLPIVSDICVSVSVICFFFCGFHLFIAIDSFLLSFFLFLCSLLYFLIYIFLFWSPWFTPLCIINVEFGMQNVCGCLCVCVVLSLSLPLSLVVCIAFDYWITKYGQCFA